jgi:methionyl-tRNA formyltransferase
MAKKAIILLLNTIPGYVSGAIKPQAQAGEPTFTKLLAKDDGRIDFNKTSAEIYNLFRGLSPWPGIWTIWNEKRLKLLNIKAVDKNTEQGKVLAEDKKFYIGCAQGAIEVLELQLEGKNPTDAKAFLNGYKNIDSAKLV